MDLGIQLYGILTHSPLPPEETLRRTAALGYTLAEPCIALDPIPGLEKVFWPLADLPRYFALMAELGLSVPSAHIAWSAPLTSHIPDLIAVAERFGVRAFVVKTPRETDDCSLQAASIAYMTAADALAEHGAALLLHNEKDDIAGKRGGKTVCEHLLDLCQGRVGLQADIGWALAGGEDPAALIRRNLHLFRSLHYKDFDAAGKPVRVGTGAVPTQACFDLARAHGIPQIVDQDSFEGDPFEELAAIRALTSSWTGARANTVSYLNILDWETGEVRTAARFDRVIEAPNWMRSTGELVYNADGLIYAWKDGRERLIPTGPCNACNNDHVLAPDENAIAVSHMTFTEGFSSRVWIVPFGGGEPYRVTENSPSFLHGWSPDGKELAYCAFRQIDGRLEVDIYAISPEGGEERRLTFGGFNDGPEYSPDGRYIWFNSTRSGLMQAWRMRRDGSEPTRMTTLEENCWFPHVSPDGRRVAFIVYHKGHLLPAEHLPNMQAEIWAMDADGGNERRLCSFFGGQGSLNVNSWAPDSRHLAFVSYETV